VVMGHGRGGRPRPPGALAATGLERPWVPGMRLTSGA
jgi:hypothetical protein